MSKKIAVIGVGNMAKAIISGIRNSSTLSVSQIRLYDVNPTQYESLFGNDIFYANSLEDALFSADYVLLSVKPQNFPEIIPQISALPFSSDKTYISIAAGITVEYVSRGLNAKNIIRVLPNLPMLVSQGVSAVCYNDDVPKDSFDFVVKIFESAGSVIKINECDINKIISVTSSSPAYVFKFIKAICDGAALQGLSDEGILNAVCDVIEGSVELIRSGLGTPESLSKAVASKGGTTEKALAVLDANNFESIIHSAMFACTERADELGKEK